MDNNLQSLEIIINDIFEPTKIYKTPSYQAKHILERSMTNFYISDEDFIILMNKLGYKNNKKNLFKIKSRY